MNTTNYNNEDDLHDIDYRLAEIDSLINESEVDDEPKYLLNNKGSTLNEVVKRVLAVRGGFIDSTTELGEDLVGAGRRFITDPLGITDEKDTENRERELILEREEKSDEWKRAGLGNYHTGGKVLNEALTLAAPTGLVTKGASTLIKGTSLAAKAGRTILGAGSAGAAIGAIKTQGDIESRLKGGAQTAAIYIAGNAAASGIGSALTRAPVQVEKLKMFIKHNIPAKAADVVENAYKANYIRAEKFLGKIIGSGVKSGKIATDEAIEKAVTGLSDDLTNSIAAGQKLQTQYRVLIGKHRRVPYDPTDLLREAERVERVLTNKGATTAKNSFLKVIKARLPKIEEGKFSILDAHDLRISIDQVTRQLDKGSKFGVNSDAGFRVLARFRSRLEDGIEKGMKELGDGDTYKLLKTMSQVDMDNKLLKKITESSFNKATGQFSKKTFTKELNAAIDAKAFTREMTNEYKIAAKELSDIMEIVGTKNFKERGIDLMQGFTTFGAAGGVSAVAGTVGLGPAGVLGAAMIGAGQLISTDLGRRILTRAGKSPETHKSILKAMIYLGAAGTDRGLRTNEPPPTDDTNQYNSVGDIDARLSEIDQLLKE